MSETTLELPRLGETMEEGQIVRWLKSVGESFVRGESLLEVETDKTLVEVPALVSGTVLEILVAEGKTVAVGTAIARVAGEGVAAANPASEQPKQPHATTPVSAAPERVAQRASEPGAPLRATPLARRIARDAELDLATIAGSGNRGRIEAEDVRRAMVGKATAPVASLPEDLRFLTIGRETLAYFEAGPAGGAPVLLLHGFGADHAAFAALAAQLARKGHHVVVPDLAGHGKTSLSAETPEALSQGLGELVRATGLASGLHLVAHSLGTAAALGLAADRSVALKRLTLLAPAGMGSEIDSGFVSGLANAATPGEISHLLRRLSVRGAMLSASALDALMAEIARRRLGALADAVAGPGGQRLDLLPALTALVARVPVEVIVGIEDRIIPWTGIAGLPPRVAVHLLARSGHMPHWDQLEDVADLISR